MKQIPNTQPVRNPLPLRTVEGRYRVARDVVVTVHSEGRPLTGREWRRLSGYCSFTAMAVGDPFKLKLPGMTVMCETPDDMARLVEKLAAGTGIEVISRALVESGLIKSADQMIDPANGEEETAP